MKVLFWQLDTISEDGIEHAFRYMNVELIIHKEKIDNVDWDQACVDTLTNYLNSTSFSCVFTVNYYPIISRVCEIYKIIYLSWVVDSPFSTLYSNTISNSVNRIFLFDYAQYQKFYPKNPTGVFYQALGADVTTFDTYIPSLKDRINYSCDISFVGSLYTERHFEFESTLPPYLNGYCKGMMDSQLLIHGYNFLEDALTPEICKEFKKNHPWDLTTDYEEDLIGIVANIFLGRKITHLERVQTLNYISQNHTIHLYTDSKPKSMTNIINKGYVEYGKKMAYVFKCSKINLNMTSKTIKTGLPLRIFDILGCQGFLITNFQSEIPEYFEDGVDLVTYDSLPDLEEKINYYLLHEEERLEIAKNGYEKVKNYYTFVHCLTQIIRTAWNL